MKKLKLIEDLEKKLKKMSWPKFILYSKQDGEVAFSMGSSDGFINNLARALHYDVLEYSSPELLIVDSARYQFFGRYEYECWVGDEKILENGYFEQFIRWATEADYKAGPFNIQSRSLAGLREFLNKDGSFVDLFNKCRKKELIKYWKKLD